MHNRVEIRRRILHALEEVIAQQGTAGVTVSLIAQRAQITKGLIYRHFGGVKGLLVYYIQASTSFPQFSLLTPQQLSLLPKIDPAQIWSAQLIGYFRQLRASKASREVLKAGLASDLSLAAALHQSQQQQLSQLAQRLSLLRDGDSSATLALLLGGLHYLTLMAHNNQPVMGIELRDEAGWQRVEESLKGIYQALSKPLSTPSGHPALFTTQVVNNN